MRVVAGSAKGRRLAAPVGSDVRPTADRVREATFNSLGSLGAVDEARVLDLFAGSGALAIEALSRGAQHATLVETNRAARDVVDANLATVGLADRASVVAGTAEGFLRRSANTFDLILCDPPYAYDGWPALWELLGRVAAPGGVVVVESDREPEIPEGWEVVRSRRYGGTVVLVLIRTADRP